MFDRSRTDTVERSAVAVVVESADGRQLNGSILVTGGRSLYEAVNGPQPFLEFDNLEGERIYLAKTAVASVRQRNVPVRAQLPRSASATEMLDPYEVLGLAKGAEWEDVRARYLNLAKTYHPDRFANVELPAEVAAYLASTTRRVNVAFAMLEDNRNAEMRRAEKRAQPVYSSAAN